eukprot:6480559-Pyramimonas_sp.AAC.1
MSIVTAIGIYSFLSVVDRSPLQVYTLSSQSSIGPLSGYILFPLSRLACEFTGIYAAHLEVLGIGVELEEVHPVAVVFEDGHPVEVHLEAAAAREHVRH